MVSPTSIVVPDRPRTGVPRSLGFVEAYLDHAASTPARPEVVEAMLPWLADHPGNPSGAHREARHARRALDDARDAVAALLGADPGDRAEALRFLRLMDDEVVLNAVRDKGLVGEVEGKT